MINLKSPLLAFGLGAVLLLLGFGFGGDLGKKLESESYLQFAETIRTGQLLVTEDAPWFSVVQSPGYPALLALSQSIFGKNTIAVLVLHAVLALIALGTIIFRFKKFVTPWALTLLCAIIFWQWRDFHQAVLSDWPAICAYLIFLSFIPQNYKEFTPNRILGLGLILSGNILIKPAFVACIATLALIIYLVVKVTDRRQIYLALILGLLPVFLYCLFNLYRIRTFTLEATIGRTLFGVACLVGAADFPSNEWPELARFSKLINENKRPQLGLEKIYLTQLTNDYSSAIRDFNYNINQALSFEKNKNHPVQYYDELMYRYAKRAILENFLSYLRFILIGLNFLGRDIWLLLMSAFMLSLLIRSGHGLSLVLGASLATHLIYILTGCATQVMSTPYYLLTLIPLGFFTVTSMLSLVKERSG